MPYSGQLPRRLAAMLQLPRPLCARIHDLIHRRGDAPRRRSPQKAQMLIVKVLVCSSFAVEPAEAKVLD